MYFLEDIYARYVATMRSFIHGMRARLSVNNARQCIIAFVGLNAIIVAHDAHVYKNVALYKDTLRKMAKTVIRMILRRTLKIKMRKARTW